MAAMEKESLIQELVNLVYLCNVNSDLQLQSLVRVVEPNEKFLATLKAAAKLYYNEKQELGVLSDLRLKCFATHSEKKSSNLNIPLAEDYSITLIDVDKITLEKHINLFNKLTDREDSAKVLHTLFNRLHPAILGIFVTNLITVLRSSVNDDVRSLGWSY